MKSKAEAVAPFSPGDLVCFSLDPSVRRRLKNVETWMVVAVYVNGENPRKQPRHMRHRYSIMVVDHECSFIGSPYHENELMLLVSHDQLSS